MVVLEPLKVTINNFSHDKPIEVSVPNFPSKPDLGNHKVTLNKTIYIEKTDFMEVSTKKNLNISYLFCIVVIFQSLMFLKVLYMAVPEKSMTKNNLTKKKARRLFNNSLSSLTISVS